MEFQELRRISFSPKLSPSLVKYLIRWEKEVAERKKKTMFLIRAIAKQKYSFPQIVNLGIAL